MKVSSLNASLYKAIATLEEGLKKAENIEDVQERAMSFRKDVFENMEEVRKYADELETIVDRDFWPYPTYGEILFSVK